MKKALIIPCYNEEKCIADVLQSLLKEVPDAVCIVVNDASSDRTAEIVNEMATRSNRVVLLDLAINIGIGGAMQTGFRYALRQGFQCAVKVDGDGQHPANEISKLLKPIEDNEADFVIGSRFLTHDGFQSYFMRRLGIHVFAFLIPLLTGLKIKDNTSGFRAYNYDALKFAAEHYPVFDYPEPEEVVLMAKNKFRILEVPVEMEERKGGTSVLSSPLHAAYYMIKVSFAVVMAAWRKPEQRRKS